MAKKKRTNIGTIRVLKGISKKTNEPYSITKFQFAPNVKILVGTYNKDTRKVENYQEVDLSEYSGSANVQDSADSLNNLLKLGYIDESEHQKRSSLNEEKGIVKDVVLVKDAD